MLRTRLHEGIAGPAPLFLAGAAPHPFATTSLGILLATVALSLPQLGLLPLEMLSGADTLRESMPYVLRGLMLPAPAPATHVVEFAQAVLFRGAGPDVVWRPRVALPAIGGVLFGLSLARFSTAMGRT